MFVRKYGENFQVEVDALDPALQRQLVEEAIDRYWDQGALAQEQAGRQVLADITDLVSPTQA